MSEFRHEPARLYVEAWIDTQDEPTLNWAWDIVNGVVGVYAEASDEPMGSMWCDWFAAAVSPDEEAHRGIHGVVEEFMHACPDDRLMELSNVLDAASRIGRGLAPHPPPPRRPTSPARRVARLTLVVDNTKKP